MSYPVYKIKSTLAIQDPDMPQPRYHTIIYVETNFNGLRSGVKHHVTGDIVSGMRYESVHYNPHDPEISESIHLTELIGYTAMSTYPHAWEEVLERIPAPAKQKAFNIKTMRTEPVKCWDPLTFYNKGEPRRQLIKCTEWTEQLAIPALERSGLLVQCTEDFSSQTEMSNP